MHGAVSTQQRVFPTSKIRQVQKKSITLNTATAPSSTVLSATFDTPPSIGNLLLMVVATSIFTTSWTIPAGWTQLMFQDSTGDTTPSGSNRSLGVAYKVAEVSEPSVVNATVFQGNAGQADMQIFEYAYVGVLDKSYTNFKASALNNVVGPIASATVEADELAFAAVGISNRTGQSYSDGFTRENADSARALIGSKILSAIGTPQTTAAWTSSASDSIGGLFTFRPWNPTMRAGLFLWLDPTDLSTITFATAPNISGYADKSGNGRNLIQATAINQSKSGTRQINNLNVIDFDGSNDHMKSASAWTLAQPFSYFVVAMLDTASNQIIIDRGTSGTPGGPILQRNSAGQWEMFGGASLVGPSADIGVPHLFSCIWNGASSVFRVDRVQVAAGNAGTQSFSSGGMTLGSSRTPSLYTNGVTGDVIVYSDIPTASEIDMIEAFMYRRYFLV